MRVLRATDGGGGGGFDYNSLSGGGGMGGGGGDTLEAKSRAETSGSYSINFSPGGAVLVVGGFLFLAVIAVILLVKKI